MESGSVYVIGGTIGGDISGWWIAIGGAAGDWDAELLARVQPDVRPDQAIEVVWGGF